MNGVGTIRVVLPKLALESYIVKDELTYQDMRFISFQTLSKLSRSLLTFPIPHSLVINRKAFFGCECDSSL